jgi:hypothetical protein
MTIIFDNILDVLNNNTEITKENFENLSNYNEYIDKIKNNILLEIKSSIDINNNTCKNILCDPVSDNILRTHIFKNDDDQYKYIFYVINIDNKYYIIKNFSSDDKYYTFTIYPKLNKTNIKVNFKLCNYIGNFVNIFYTACHIEKNLNKYNNILNTICNYKPISGEYNSIMDRDNLDILKNMDYVSNIKEKNIINSLNNNQYESLNRLTDNLEIIQGPPGTGKSTTIIGILQERIPINHKILCVCVQNQAIESIVIKLKKYNLNFVVFGNIDRLCNESKLYSLQYIFENDKIIKELNEKINNINMKLSQKITELEENEKIEYINKCEKNISIIYRKIMKRQYRITNNYHIYVGTISSSYGINNYVNKIDTIIIDEAGYITEMDLLSLIVRIPKNIIMIGDHKQLRPFTYINNTVVNSTNKKEYYISPFERLINNNYKYYTLNTQYRMDKPICDLVSQLFYDDKLITSESVKSIYKNSLEYHHIYGKTLSNNNSFYNLEEIIYIQKLCDNYNDKHILILTFYSEQINQFKKYINKENIDIYTIDSSQGREADIVIISTVCDNYRNFIDDKNRLCVMLSRAKYKLIFVGQINKFINKSKLWFKIFNKINMIK